MLNYNINDEGIMSIYYDNNLIAEISECNNMTDMQLESLTKEVFEQSEFYKTKEVR